MQPFYFNLELLFILFVSLLSSDILHITVAIRVRHNPESLYRLKIVFIVTCWVSTMNSLLLTWAA